MKLSIAWLKEILPEISEKLQSDSDIQELAHKLTMAGLEVDSVSKAGGDFSGVVVGRIVNCEKHPDADKLRVCEVDVGSGELLQIVCGAPNARTDIGVAVAMVGAKLPDFKIKKSKLRGVASHGMLCSVDELGLPGERDGIMELPVDAELGQDLREYLHLNDTCIEIELTPNRGDCLSMYGLAREIAVLYNLEAPKIPEVKSITKTAVTIKVSSSVEDKCSFYSARRIKGLQSNVVTPVWLSSRLNILGIRPISPLVDICNYTMLLFGQPMHAFATDKLQGEELKIRMAKSKEKLVLLDEKEITLDKDCLVIADEHDAAALAGVMGGLQSSVSLETTDVVLESAVFDRVQICLQARKFHISTDSSYRFERGIDSALTMHALDFATNLVHEILGGESEEAVVLESEVVADRVVNLRRESIARHLGIEIDDAEVARILNTLGFKCEANEWGWIAEVPSFRHDVSIEVDLVEELARIYGYDNIPEIAKPMFPDFSNVSSESLAISKLKAKLASIGYRECINYSFCDASLQEKLVADTKPAIKLLYPISDQMSVMRLSMWPQLLSNALFNKNRQVTDLRLFEVGACYFRDGKKAREERKLALLLTGHEYPKQWGVASTAVDFFSLKGDLAAIFAHSGLQVEYASVEHHALHPGQSAGLFVDGKQIGFVGVLHPEIGRDLDFDRPIILAELDLEPLLNTPNCSFTSISKFPAITRDLALVVNEDISVDQILNSVHKAGGELLVNVKVFDIYRGEGVQKNEKSIALGLTFMEPSRTLIDEEINELIQVIVREVESQLNAKLRT